MISGIQSMHNPEVVINANLGNVRQVGQDCLDKFSSVKITQQGLIVFCESFHTFTQIKTNISKMLGEFSQNTKSPSHFVFCGNL